MHARRSRYFIPFLFALLQLTIQAWYLQVAAGLVLPAFIEEKNVSSVVGKAAASQGTGSSATPSLSDIPKQDATTSEDCLFLDVLVPQAIYESPRRTDTKGKGGGMYIVICRWVITDIGQHQSWFGSMAVGIRRAIKVAMLRPSSRAPKTMARMGSYLWLSTTAWVCLVGSLVQL